jgi:hypothetical protein
MTQTSTPAPPPSQEVKVLDSEGDICPRAQSTFNHCPMPLLTHSFLYVAPSHLACIISGDRL